MWLSLEFRDIYSVRNYVLRLKHSIWHGCGPLLPNNSKFQCSYQSALIAAFVYLRHPSSTSPTPLRISTSEFRRFRRRLRGRRPFLCPVNHPFTERNLPVQILTILSLCPLSRHRLILLHISNSMISSNRILLFHCSEPARVDCINIFLYKFNPLKTCIFKLTIFIYF